MNSKKSRFRDRIQITKPGFLHAKKDHTSISTRALNEPGISY